MVALGHASFDISLSVFFKIKFDISYPGNVIENTAHIRNSANVITATNVNWNLFAYLSV